MEAVSLRFVIALTMPQSDAPSPSFVERISLVRPHEWPAVVAAFLYFFCLLCGYYLLRPVRDEMGIQAGLQNLASLFTATLAVMLLVVPVFGALSSRLPRRRLLPLVYGFFVLNLLGFHALFDAAIAPARTAMVFFVWVSVYNLFVVSVFWSFMAELFDTEQARRVYGVIAAGGSFGALCGPLLAALLAPRLGIAKLLLLSAAFLALTVVCIVYLGRWLRRQGSAPAALAERAVGGGLWDGIKLVAGSRFLLAACGFVLLYSASSTLLYFEQQHIVAATYTAPTQRTALFARMDLAVNALTLLLQVFVSGRLLSRWGIRVGLVMVPLISVLGFAALALDPVLAVLVVFGVARRAGEFALAKPARESLFNILTPAEKYKAKNFMDTAVYRSGDALSAWLFEGIKGLGLSGVATVGGVAALLWALLGRWLVNAHHLLLRNKS